MVALVDLAPRFLATATERIRPMWIGAPRIGKPAPSAMRVPWWVIVCTGLSPIVLTTAWLVAQTQQPRSYSPMHDTVSLLASRTANDPWIMTLALVLLGVCYLGAAAGLTVLRRTARIALAVAGFASFGIALFREPASGPTLQHLAFTTLGAAIIAVWPLMTVRRGAGPGVVALPTAVITTAAFLALAGWLLVEARAGHVVGLAERLDSSIQVCWPFVVALGLRAATTRSPREPVPIMIQAENRRDPARARRYARVAAGRSRRPAALHRLTPPRTVTRTTLPVDPA